MLLILYKNLDGDNVVNKVLVEGLEIEIKFKGDFDFTNPELILSSIEGFDYKDYNYCSIPYNNSYYFIRNVKSINNRLVALTCETDYLETFKDSFLNGECRYLTPIKKGDYGDVSLDITGRRITTNYVSGVVLVPTTKAILSVMGGFYG